MGLPQGPRGGRFLVSRVPLYHAFPPRRATTWLLLVLFLLVLLLFARIPVRGFILLSIHNEYDFGDLRSVFGVSQGSE